MSKCFAYMIRPNALFLALNFLICNLVDKERDKNGEKDSNR